MNLIELLGVLMDYPRDQLWQRRRELLQAAASQALPRRRRGELERFVQGLFAAKPPDVRDDWLSYFDDGRPMSLALFEHSDGRAHARSQAMVDPEHALLGNGVASGESEMPDHLPVALEYLSRRPVDEARARLRGLRPVVAARVAQAREIGCPYRVLFEILIDVADGTLDLQAPQPRASHARRIRQGRIDAGAAAEAFSPALRAAPRPEATASTLR